MERLLEQFTPENYFIQLNVNKHTSKVFGHTEITGVPHTDNIRLHAKNLKITEVTVDGEAADFAMKDDELIIAEASHHDGTHPVKITVKYTFLLSNNMNGCYLSSYDYQAEGEKEPHTEYLVSTQFESHYARECFPCIDEPEAKATFDLKIITPDTEDTVISNMSAKEDRVLEYESVNPDVDPSKGVNIDTKVKKKIVTFETTPKMPTYLLAFCIGRFHKKSKTSEKGIKVTTYCTLNHPATCLTYANDVATKSLDFYSEKFGKYPLEKLDQVAIPDFEAGAMENWGLVTYRESCLLTDKESTHENREYVSTVIAHELAHQWFGNLVTMKWWDNLWLNESFANMMQYVCVDAIYPSYKIYEDFFTGECFAALNRDCLPGVQAVQQEVNDPSEIATLFDGAIVYAKGARLMLWLYRLLGEKNFYKGMKDYFKKFAYSNTSGDDLWAAMQPYADFDVKKFMDTWILQPGYPVITDDNQQRFLLTGATDDSKWEIPEVTDDMSGHYLINLATDEFSDKIAQFSHLSLEQKLRLFIDRMFLAKTSLVSSASLLDLPPLFKKEKNYRIWEMISGVFGNIKLFYSPEDEDYTDFQRYIANVIEVQKNRLGLETREHDSEDEIKLRALVIANSYFCEDKEVNKTLAKMYKDNLGELDPEMRQAIMRAKMRETDEKIFPDFLKMYKKEHSPEIKDDLLYVMAGTKNHNKDLAGLLKKPEVVRPQDHIYLLAFMLRNYYTHKVAFDWILGNWDYVKQLTGEKMLEDYIKVLASSIKTQEEADRYDEFTAPLLNEPALRRAIDVSKGEIAARLRLIALDREDVHRHLKELLEKS
ncbi:M1 family metallopeptidase [Candidatus Saccharibacteria bacterium]|nr:M1 family metallopeptidase [Candidatus Saccharibacteria bacterium]